MIIEKTACRNESYCLIFRTSASFDGDLGGISGADSICNTDPANPNNGSQFKAVLVDGINRIACTSTDCSTGGVSEGVDWSLKPSVEYRKLDETTVIGETNSSAIFPFPLINGISTTAFSLAWTGINSGYLSSSLSCGGWLDNSFGPQGRLGRVDQVDSNFFSDTIIGVDPCDGALGAHEIICAEQ